MAKKSKKLNFFSTNPDVEWNDDEDYFDEETLEPKAQKLRVTLDRKKRKGKDVTLVTGFVGEEQDLKDLGKTLKSKCGVGGSAKDGEIMIQGNHVLKVLELLKNMGYKQTKKIGG
jgi:translation initiation factor 1